MVPPRSPAPSTNASCSAMVAMTGAGACGSNSEELAPSMPATDRANSITMHCSPRHSPSTGILRVRAYVSAPILPSMPRMPNPPGTQMPSTSPRCWAAPASVAHSSDGTQRRCTLASWAKPPARIASATER